MDGRRDEGSQLVSWNLANVEVGSLGLVEEGDHLVLDHHQGGDHQSDSIT